jgi:ABC-type sugar transport system ATPase subunit
MCEVRLTGVSKRYEGAKGGRPAIERLDLTFPSGELVVLIGPSGCGKSTTLRIVAGLEEPTAGRCGSTAGRHRAAAGAARPGDGVPELRALPAHDGVREPGLRAAHPPRARGRDHRSGSPPSPRRWASSALLERRPKALSGGQRQRVAIGRAVVRKPKVFLFDEPLSNLDAKLRGEMRREIARIHKDAGATSLYVTHDQIEAMTLADRIVVLRTATCSRSAARSRSTSARPTASSPASSARRR